MSIDPPSIPPMDATPIDHSFQFQPPKTTHPNTLDKMLMDFPDLYPNGDCTTYVDKVPGASIDKKPVIGWAKELTKKVKYSCLGCWVCPHFGKGCSYRVRPQVPRRGIQNTGRIPPPKSNQKCHLHPDAQLLLHKCNCKWTIKERNETQWMITHTGIHSHPIPPPNRASHAAKKKLREIILHNPEAKPCQLTTGISGGKINTLPRVGDIDPKFEHAGYVAKVRQSTLKKINMEMTGSEYATESLDAVFELFQKIEKRSPGLLLSGNLMPNKQHVTYASEQMRDLLGSSVTGFTTDSVEGMVESVYFKGEINVTMTSSWCPDE